MRTIPFADPGTPDTRGPLWFLLWVGRQQWRTQVAVLVMGVAWMVTIALVPAAVGRGIDEGIVAGDTGGLVRWSLVLLGLGTVAAAAGAARHYFAVYYWLYASYRSAQLTAGGIERAGPALTRTMPSGEVVAVFANDVMRIGGLFDVAGRFAGSAGQLRRGRRDPARRVAAAGLDGAARRTGAAGPADLHRPSAAAPSGRAA